MTNVTEKTIIGISDEGDTEPHCILSFGAFLRENEFEPEEITDMANGLRNESRYVGGGGAAQIYILNIVE